MSPRRLAPIGETQAFCCRVARQREGSKRAEAGAPLWPGPPCGVRRGCCAAAWRACCLPFGSFGSMSVGSGSRVASPPPKPLPSITTFENCSLDVRGATGAMKAEEKATRHAMRRERNSMMSGETQARGGARQVSAARARAAAALLLGGLWVAERSCTLCRQGCRQACGLSALRAGAVVLAQAARSSEGVLCVAEPRCWS